MAVLIAIYIDVLILFTILSLIFNGRDFYDFCKKVNAGEPVPDIDRRGWRFVIIWFIPGVIFWPVTFLLVIGYRVYKSPVIPNIFHGVVNTLRKENNND